MIMIMMIIMMILYYMVVAGPSGPGCAGRSEHGHVLATVQLISPIQYTILPLF